MINIKLTDANTKGSSNKSPFLSSIFLKWLFVLFLLSIFPYTFLYFLLRSGYESIVLELLEFLKQYQISTFGPAVLKLGDFRLQSQLVAVTLFILMAAGSVVASFFFSSRIVQLLKSVKKIRRGDFDTVITPSGEDEVGELAREIKNTIEQFKLVRERDQKLSKAKSEFISIAAHQLRTPLTGLRWSLGEIFRGEATPDQQHEFIKKDLNIVEQAIQLVGNLLDVVMIEEGKFGYAFQQSDITSFIKKVIGNLAHFAESQQIKINFITPPDPLPPVFVDHAGITIVLNNLIANAISYSYERGSVEISCAVDVDKKLLAVSIKDYGIGITKEDIPNVFNKFFRAQNAKKLQPNGTGIGLFLVKSIIERHGGAIWVTSEEKKGAMFTFTLPLQEKSIPAEGIIFEEFFEELGSGQKAA